MFWQRSISLSDSFNLRDQSTRAKGECLSPGMVFAACGSLLLHLFYSLVDALQHVETCEDGIGHLGN